MRIPLDYYRILGLPIQATAEQLQQAHRDRTLQLPRREFSEAAIAARRELIDEAFAILSDPIKRQAYDASFLANSYDLPDLEEAGSSDRLPSENGAFGQPSTGVSAVATEADDPQTSSIEIQENQLIGALLILLEMGEYELVMRLGQPYLGGDGGSDFAHDLGNDLGSDLGNAKVVRADIVLTIALACLELGREQWQQGQYENAAESLTTGKDVLLQASLFAGIRGEMYADLAKLRPYRVLELVALPEPHREDRETGLELLSEMLEERGGIDGTGDDLSGLTMDDFLRFIQQLRSYLTSAEQHALFEKEARRPSAVATYLAVYALLARGFAQRQPGLVRRAKQMLSRLGNRQDVHLEQAVCALLLGQTDEASRALDLSQEVESIAFIREHSQGAPDLLPGLCLYSERWLQNEVFPHFRDLARKQASLKEYFADEDVQAYLEELPTDPTDALSQFTAPPATYRTARSESAPVAEPRFPLTGQIGQTQTVQNREYATGYASNGASSTAVIEPPEVVDDGISVPSNPPDWEGRSPERGRPEVPPRRNPVVPAERRPKGRSPRLDRLLFLAALSLVGIILVAALAHWLMRGRSTQPTIATAPNTAPNATPTVAIPKLLAFQTALNNKVKPPAAVPEVTGNLTTESAQTIIKTWLTAKAAAMGETHAVDQLPKVLTGEVLSLWQGWAATEKTNNTYLKYEHGSVTVGLVQASENNPDQAIVEATVSEKKEVYADGKLEAPASPVDLQIRYTLIRQNGQWLIQSIEPI